MNGRPKVLAAVLINLSVDQSTRRLMFIYMCMCLYV